MEQGRLQRSAGAFPDSVHSHRFEKLTGLQKGVRELAKDHLDMTVILSEQRDSNLRTVFRMVRVCASQCSLLMTFSGEGAFPAPPEL